MSNKNLFAQLITVILFFMCTFTPVFAIETNNKCLKIVTFKYINDLILDHSDQNQIKMIQAKVKTNPESAFYKEVELDMIYATHIFDPLLTQKDVEDSLELILELKASDSKKAKMFLYESIYHKRQGKWTVAKPLLEFSYELLKDKQNKAPEDLYLLSLAQFELGIFNQKQDLIVDSIGNLEKVINCYPDNVVFLTAISDLFRYIEVPEQLYNSFSERIELYDTHLNNIKKKMFLKYSNNIFNANEKYDENSYKTIMQPLTEEILFRWKIAKFAQDQPADMMYFFQVDKDNEVKNIRLISTSNASKKLQELTTRAIEEARAPFLTDKYLYDTMDILFIFSFK